ncbi:ABC transporter permease [Paracoccus laeviglucosivorans]|uniref:Fructose transport system permease protein n=1 Tax=Paracoccus laeviglucosivorans TaxID=1197861 RepID=A0A521F0H2_9RHOB|nr:ABC transporter permease [Paracoccus laeviglucosivorans]SMO89714.1 fructose transport system permease protein [Paracoccus laeviglucosivorans]
MPSDTPQFEERGGWGQRVINFLHGNPTVIPLLVLVIGLAIFSMIVGKRFFHPFNLSLVLQQVTVIGMLALAQTLIILTAGIDLSVGAIMVLASVVMGQLALTYGWPPELALVAGIAAGGICGALNGLFITLLRLPPFIVTLGTWSIFNAVVQFWSGGQTIRQQEIAATAPILQWTGTAMQVGAARLTLGSILMLGLAVFLWYMLNRTAYGRHIYATGNDAEAARLSGINTRRVLFSVYLLAGGICGVAGWVLIGRIGAVSPLGGASANLDSITAVVIGGTSLFGGRGSILGTLIGALIVGFFRNGLALAGLDVLWQEFTIGCLIIMAVGFDQWLRRIAA